MRKLNCVTCILEGREGVSPFMASAWFPAAPQGQISINYGIKGFSKTIVADRASSLMAIGYAARTIIRGKCDFILAGGMEAPVTPYALLCCNTSGMLTENNDHPHTAPIGLLIRIVMGWPLPRVQGF